MPFDFADPEIEAILQTYMLEKLHQSDDSVYALRPDLTLAYVNQGWSKFASENSGSQIPQRWPLGCNIQAAIPDVLRPFFADNFSRCLNSKSPWQHQYECSSAQVYREFLMTTYPLGNHQGLLIVNSLFRSGKHNRRERASLDAFYRDDNAIITQCAHCRRIRRRSDVSCWDWVPDWVRSCPQNTSHGLCEACFGYFYPGGVPMLHGYPPFFSSVS